MIVGRVIVVSRFGTVRELRFMLLDGNARVPTDAVGSACDDELDAELDGAWLGIPM